MEFQQQALESSYSCTICEDPLRLDPEYSLLSTVPPVVATKCGHMYHHACLLRWFTSEHEKNEGVNKESTCPICRQAVIERELVKIFLPVNNARPLDGYKTKAQLQDEIRTLKEKVHQLGLEFNSKAALLEENRTLKAKVDQLGLELALAKSVQSQSAPQAQSQYSLSSSDLTGNSSSNSSSAEAINISPANNKNTLTPIDDSILGSLLESNLILLDTDEEDDHNPFLLLQSEDDQPRSRRVSSPLFTAAAGEDEGIKVGDSVIWFSEDGANGMPYKGPVLWLGDIDDKQFAAVVFQEEIGNTDGIINYTRKFVCDPTYTRLIQLDELVLAKYFAD